jgi:hypothetical protein
MIDHTLDDLNNIAKSKKSLYLELVSGVCRYNMFILKKIIRAEKKK